MQQEDKDTTLRWKIDKDIELYRFYLDISVKAAVFLMGLTGAISSYVLSNADSKNIVGIALAFPALMNAGFAVLFFYSSIEAKRIANLHKEACEELGVSEFNMNPLRSVCQIFCLMCGVATVGLLWLMLFYN
ncbi:MAG: hypothetical protein MN733_31595 [Nitrososphaera sp.]|nr:hypothetical protein [Nitrososphaera sp.]